MPELELALRDLGGRLDWPAAPDLEQPVRRRLRKAPARRRLLSRRRVVIAFAVLAVAVGAVFAVPQTRAAILEFFHLRGVTIEPVQELPTVPVQTGLGTFLGDRVTLAEAYQYAYKVNGTRQVLRGIGYNVPYAQQDRAWRAQRYDRDFALM